MRAANQGRTGLNPLAGYVISRFRREVKWLSEERFSLVCLKRVRFYVGDVRNIASIVDALRLHRRRLLWYLATRRDSGWVWLPLAALPLRRPHQ